MDERLAGLHMGGVMTYPILTVEFIKVCLGLHGVMLYGWLDAVNGVLSAFGDADRLDWYVVAARSWYVPLHVSGNEAYMGSLSGYNISCKCILVMSNASMLKIQR